MTQAPTGPTTGRPGRLPGWVTVLLACAASLASIAFVDRPAAQLTHDVFHGDRMFVALTHIVDPLLPAASLGLLGLGGAMLAGWRPGPVWRIVLCACLAVLATVAVKDQAKYAFGRLWPETWVNRNPSWIADGAYGFFPFHGGTGWTSFPSGHMAVVTAPMAVVWRSLRAWRVLTLVPIGLVAVGLYGADYHFVGDMIAGTLLGWVCARVVLALTSLSVDV